MPARRIAGVTFTSEDRVRDVIHNFNADGFGALYPRYRGGRPPSFTLAQRQQIKTLALSRPQDHDLPFSTWSLSKLADFLVAEGVVEDISQEGLRELLDGELLAFLPYLRSLYPSGVPGDRVGQRQPPPEHQAGHPSGDWAAANNLELAYTPPTPATSTASRDTSRRCATSPWTAPTTPATSSKPA